MITRLRIRLHDLRRGHQVYEATYFEDVTPVEFQRIYTYRDQVSGYACHGCGWRLTR